MPSERSCRSWRPIERLAGHGHERFGNRRHHRAEARGQPAREDRDWKHRRPALSCYPRTVQSVGDTRNSMTRPQGDTPEAL